MSDLEKRTQIFESVPVRRAVCMQIIPAIASQMIALIYNLADTWFVGLLNDPDQTAGITVVSSSYVMLTVISSLFGVGAASLIACHLGRKEVREARQVSAVAFWGGLLCAVLFSGSFLLLYGPILRLCGATDGTFAIAWRYAKWTIVIGGPVTIMSSLLAHLVRAEGNAAGASFGVSLGGVINIILDPFFVLPRFLGLGAEGAGIATAVSNLISVLYFLIYILRSRRVGVVDLRPGNLRYTGVHIRGILSIGLPSAVQFVLTVVSVSAQINFVSKYCTEAVAALGIITKLNFLPLYFSMGVSSGLLPLLAYNHSAGNHARRRGAFRFGCLISLSFAVFCVICYEAFAPFLTGLFIKDPVTIAFGAAFLRLSVIAMPMMSLCHPMIIQFQALGRVRESLVCSILRKGALDIPLLFLLDRLLPLYGCMLVQPIVDMVALVVAWLFYRRNDPYRNGDKQIP